MRRSGVSSAMVAGLLIAGILIGVTGYYVATNYPTKIVTQTETTTGSLGTTSTTTLTASTQPVLIACGSIITTDTTLDMSVGGCDGSGLVIGANGITLDCAGHTIAGIEATEKDSGINLTGISNVTVKNCRVTGFRNDFFIFDSSNNTFTANIVLGSEGSGFDIFDSSNNTLTGNEANGNSGTDFYLYGSDGNTLTRNDAVASQEGFFVSVSSNNTLTLNTAGSDQYGFFLYGTDNTLRGNNAVSNSQYGYFDRSTGSGTLGTANSYEGNNCEGNGVGCSSPSGLDTPRP